jgi:cyclopropane-fatty-acyl-phospholipid synthase
MAKSSTIRVDRDAAPASGSAARWASLLRRTIGPFEAGSLNVDLPSGKRLVLPGCRPGRNAHVAVRGWRALARLAFSGDIGFAECLGDGECSSDDLKTLLLWATDNAGAKRAVGDGLAVSRLAARVRHALRANTLRNSRRNISAHYDLGNAFYAAWLDDDLNYSSGIYTSASATLAGAQAAKIGRVAELMELGDGERVLEIGCGWGALAAHLIEQHNCHVTGLTLSTEQLSYARNRLAAFGERADIRLTDYRDVSGTFDRIASIEMMEAVGEAYWPIYLQKIASSLAADGTAVLQVISIDERRYENYRRCPDFIQLSVFPGGMLPTKTIIAAQAERAGLRLNTAEYFGTSYARTLSDWRIRFDQAWPRLSELGFDERFRRLWNYYLVYCEVGFEAGWLDVGLYQFRHAR